MAAYVYLVGGTHRFDRIDIPILYQERSSQGIAVDDNTWVGAHAVIFDGVRIGKECIIGAGAVVNKDVPDWKIAAGSPARVFKDRRETEARQEVNA
ncbi:acyltransferase [candidate division KSB1 bacterium]|nr:acyltransferase [candidate division KSB1 bacterium]